MSKREITSSRDYYGSHNTRDFNKGKSFNYNFDWNTTKRYFNDDYIQDFVSYKGKLYVCMKSNIGIVPTNEEYWYYTGMEGQRGEKGETGTLFIPTVDADGNISWSNDAGLPNPSVANLKGAKGDKGDTGESAMLRATSDHIQWKTEQDTVWHNLVALTNLKGDTGEQGPVGLSLEYIWDGTKLGVRAPGTIPYEWMDLRGEKGNKGDKGIKGDKGDKGDKGLKGDQGDRGESILLQVSTPDASGKRYLQKRYNLNAQWENVLDIDEARGPRGYSIVVERNLKTNNIEYRYEDEPATANQILINAQDIVGPKGDSIAKMYVADDGYLYVITVERADDGTEKNVTHRAGYVRGDKGNDGREVLLRIDTDENSNPSETGTWTHIQWKYAGDEYKLWHNLVQINELFNIAIRGIKATEKDVQYDPGTGSITTYKRVYLWNTRTVKRPDGSLEQIDYLDLEGNVVPKDLVENGTWEEIEAYTPHPPYITYVDLEELDFITDAYYDDDPNSEWYHYLIITVSTSTGERVIRIPVDYFYSEGDGIEITDTKVINVHLDNRPMSEGGQDVWSNNANPNPQPFLTVDENGLRITGLLGKLVRDFQYNVRGDFDMDIIMYDGTVHSVHLPAEYLLSSASYDKDTHTLHLYYYDDVEGEYHDLPIPLDDLVDIYGVTDGGGLGITDDGKFYIKEKGITYDMLNDELREIIDQDSVIITCDKDAEGNPEGVEPEKYEGTLWVDPCDDDGPGGGGITVEEDPVFEEWRNSVNVIIGWSAEIEPDNAIAATAVGQSTLANSGAVALGSNAKATSIASIAIGNNSSIGANGLMGIAIGDTASCLGQYSIALGKDTSAEVANSAAIGYNSKVISGDITDSQDTTYGVISVGYGQNGWFRRIINVKDGLYDHHAATVGQMNAAIDLSRYDGTGISRIQVTEITAELDPTAIRLSDIIQMDIASTTKLQISNDDITMFAPIESYFNINLDAGADILLRYDAGNPAQILGQSDEGTSYAMLALRVYNPGAANEYDQIEVGSASVHLNLNTLNDTTFGKYITYDTQASVGGPAKKEVIATFTEGVLNLPSKYFTPVNNGSGGLILSGLTFNEIQEYYAKYQQGLTSIQTNTPGLLGLSVIRFSVDDNIILFEYRFGIANYTAGVVNVYKALISATTANLITSVTSEYTYDLPTTNNDYIFRNADMSASGASQSVTFDGITATVTNTNGTQLDITFTSSTPYSNVDFFMIATTTTNPIVDRLEGIFLSTTPISFPSTPLYIGSQVRVEIEIHVGDTVYEAVLRGNSDLSRAWGIIRKFS